MVWKSVIDEIIGKEERNKMGEKVKGVSMKNIVKGEKKEREKNGVLIEIGKDKEV